MGNLAQTEERSGAIAFTINIAMAAALLIAIGCDSPAGPCATNSDCASGAICMDGICTSDSDQDGAMSDSDGDVPQCLTDLQCPADARCMSGICLGPDGQPIPTPDGGVPDNPDDGVPSVNCPNEQAFSQETVAERAFDNWLEPLVADWRPGSDDEQIRAEACALQVIANTARHSHTGYTVTGDRANQVEHLYTEEVVADPTQPIVGLGLSFEYRTEAYVTPEFFRFGDNDPGYPIDMGTALANLFRAVLNDAGQDTMGPEVLDVQVLQGGEVQAVTVRENGEGGSLVHLLDPVIRNEAGGVWLDGFVGITWMPDGDAKVFMFRHDALCGSAVDRDCIDTNEWTIANWGAPPRIYAGQVFLLRQPPNAWGGELVGLEHVANDLPQNEVRRIIQAINAGIFPASVNVKVRTLYGWQFAGE